MSSIASLCISHGSVWAPLIAAIIQRLEDGHEHIFVRYAAARALGDLAVDGCRLALASLKSQFSVPGLEAVTMSALGKLMNLWCITEKTLVSRFLMEISYVHAR